MATPNPILQQILKEIGGHADQGRSNLNWGVVSESRKHKVREATPETDEKPEDTNDDLPANGAAPESAKPKPETQSTPIKGAPKATATPEDEVPASEDKAPNDADAEDAASAKEDAEKAKAELEKAKAEKDQAEQDIEQNAYVKLNSPSGVSFLLGKLVNHAFQTNTMDALASEFVNKLKITNPEDYQIFSDDMIPYKNIPGMVEFLDSVKSLSASGKQEPTEG
jgi:hypothetical protein